MMTIDDLIKKIKELQNNSANFEQIKQINKNLVGYLNKINIDEISDDNIEGIISKIVTLVRGNKNWKFNTWNIPDGIKKMNESMRGI